MQLAVRVLPIMSMNTLMGGKENINLENNYHLK